MSRSIIFCLDDHISNLLWHGLEKTLHYELWECIWIHDPSTNSYSSRKFYGEGSDSDTRIFLSMASQMCWNRWGQVTSLVWEANWRLWRVHPTVWILFETIVWHIVLLIKEVISDMLQTYKRKHMVVNHIPVTLTCDRRCHTYHCPHSSSRKQSPEENATATSSKCTLARRINRFIGFAP